VPDSEREFARAGREETRLKAGATLPPPAPVFPRYIEPDAAARA
jgi:methionyl-tRNA synthetase